MKQMMVLKILVYLVTLVHHATSFVSQTCLAKVTVKCTNGACHNLYAHSDSSPMIVVGSTNEALGSAMAYCASDVLRSDNAAEDRRSPVPPPQLIAFFNKPSLEESPSQQLRLPSETVSSLQNALLFLGPSMDDYEQILANSLQLLTRISQTDASNDYEDPMLYSSIEFGSKDGANTMQSLSLVRNRFSFLGLNVNTVPTRQDEGRFVMSREEADAWGNKLQTLLDGDHSSAAVTMDIRTHLAMLQANSLPRSRGVLGDKDVWAITDTIEGELHVDNGCGTLMEYQFNYNDPFGGCDPLMCQSTGYTASGYNVATHREANDAFAAAYSTLMGLGINPMNSICIATSVKAIFNELGRTDEGGVYCPPPYSWNTIDRIIERTHEAEQSIKLEDGLPRKLYKEFGYQ